MTDLGNYIRELLSFNNVVIIPDLGGFKTRYKPAQVDSSLKSFHPPSKQIIFDDKLVHDNGILIYHISAKKGLSVEQTRKTVNDYVIEIKKQLDQGKEVEIANLGHLYKDKAYKIHFVQEPEENLLLDSYGLGSFTLDDSYVGDKKDIRYDHYPQVNVQDNIQGPRNKYLIPVAIITLLILVGALVFFHDHSFYLFQKGNDINEQADSGVNNEQMEKLNQKRIADSVISSHIEKNLDSITNKQNALFFTDKEQKESDKYARYNKFYLIAGSFTKYENAVKLRDKLINNGYYPEILKTGHSVYRVSINSFTNRQKALDELYQLRETKFGRSVWILSVM